MGTDRRHFLKLTGTGIAGIFILPMVQGCESHVITPLVQPKAEPFITPINQFFVQNGGEGAIQGWSQPVFNTANDWSLTVKHGNNTVATITWDALMSIVSAEPNEEITLLKTIECVLQSDVRTSATGFSGNAYWTGIPLRKVLEGIDLTASSPVETFLLTAADGFTNNIQIARIRDAATAGLVEPLLVYKMNGEPLPPEHGFPVRLIIQEGYGYMNMKWLTEIQAVDFLIEDFGTYQEQGFVDGGLLNVNSRATSLFDQIQVPSGPLTIFGFALSGSAPIDKVEVSIDGSSPEAAEIISLDELQATSSLPPNIKQILDAEEYPFRAVWTPWRYSWEGKRGDHQIAIRAFDKAGNSQPDVDENIDDGQNRLTTYRVTVA
ncbi:MAG: molybdopterin-dependent oxidoreductase [Candidatus Kapaibacterium sp.]